MSEDIRDILDIERGSGPQVSKEEILGMNKKKVSLPSVNRQNRRPEGMAREVFALLYNDKNDMPPVIETETGRWFFIGFFFPRNNFTINCYLKSYFL